MDIGRTERRASSFCASGDALSGLGIPGVRKNNGRTRVGQRYGPGGIHQSLQGASLLPGPILILYMVVPDRLPHLSGLQRANDREWKHRSTVDYTENDYVTLQTPEHAALRKETSEELGESVNSLAEPYRSVVQLYYFNRQSYQEIAEVKGVSVKTVESQLYRARQIMRRKGERWE